jgi:peptidoglycan hydrolase CwlO-like protein
MKKRAKSFVLISGLAFLTTGFSIPGCGANAGAEKRIEDLQKKVTKLEEQINATRKLEEEGKSLIEELKKQNNQSNEWIAVAQGRLEQNELRIRELEEQVQNLQKKLLPPKTKNKAKSKPNLSK